MAYRTDYLPGVRPTIPQDGLAGLRENWRADLLAGLIAFLVSLPLSIGIALASGAPAVSGLLTAVVGGLLVALINGSYLTVNAPAPGLIIIMYQAAVALGGGDVVAGYPHVLAVTVVAGVLLILISRLALNPLVALVPESVVHGLMAAVGLIVLSKEVHTALGTKASGGTAIELFLALPTSLQHAHPAAAGVAGACLALLALPNLLPKRLRKTVPMPIVAAGVGVLMGSALGLPAELRVQMPEQWTRGIVFADFTQALTGPFWAAVVTLTLVQGLESILSAAAVERLDPYRRRTNQQRDLAAVGLGSALSGAIGGQPMIASIVRGAAVVQAGGRTRWANFFNGVCMLVCLLLLAGAIRQIPLAALAAILLATAYQLTSVKVWKDAAAQGRWAFYVFLVTVAGCLATDLLVGVGLGLATHMGLHILRGAPLRALLKPVIDIDYESDERTVYVHFRHPAAFANERALRQALEPLPGSRLVIVDCTDARLKEASVVEQLRRIGAEYAQTGGRFEFVGLPGDTSEHELPTDPLPAEIAVHPIPATPSGFHRRELSRLAVSLGADFLPHKYAAHARFVGYPSFEEKLVKYAENTLQGPLPCAPSSLRYVIKDLTVAEYLGIAAQEFQLTVWLADGLPEPIPHFTLRSESLMTRVADYVGFADINFAEYPTFSNRYLLRGREVDAIRAFFTPGLLEYLERQTLDFRLESNGRGLLLYLDERLLNPDEIRDLHAIGCGFLQFVVAPSPPA